MKKDLRKAIKAKRVDKEFKMNEIEEESEAKLCVNIEKMRHN